MTHKIQIPHAVKLGLDAASLFGECQARLVRIGLWEIEVDNEVYAGLKNIDTDPVAAIQYLIRNMKRGRP